MFFFGYTRNYVYMGNKMEKVMTSSELDREDRFLDNEKDNI